MPQRTGSTARAVRNRQRARCDVEGDNIDRDKNFYAVLTNKKGVYTDWPTAEAAGKAFRGSAWWIKAFPTYEEAYAYLMGYLKRFQRLQFPSVQESINAYANGTYIAPTTYFIIPDIPPKDPLITVPAPNQVSWVKQTDEDTTLLRLGALSLSSIGLSKPYISSPTPASMCTFDTVTEPTSPTPNLPGVNRRSALGLNLGITIEAAPLTPEAGARTAYQRFLLEGTPSPIKPILFSTPNRSATPPNNDKEWDTSNVVASPSTSSIWPPGTRMRKFYENVPTILNGHQREFLEVFFSIEDDDIGSLARAIMKVVPADRSDILKAFLPKLVVYGMNPQQGTWFLDWVFGAQYEEVDDLPDHSGVGTSQC